MHKFIFWVCLRQVNYMSKSFVVFREKLVAPERENKIKKWGFYSVSLTMENYTTFMSHQRRASSSENEIGWESSKNSNRREKKESLWLNLEISLFQFEIKTKKNDAFGLKESEEYFLTFTFLCLLCATTVIIWLRRGQMIAADTIKQNIWRRSPWPLLWFVGMRHICLAREPKGGFEW